MPQFSAVIVAAGGSQRFLEKFNRPSLRSKVFLNWQGRPIFLHSVERILHWIDGEVALVIRPDDRPYFEEVLKDSSMVERVRLVAGGARRQDSVRNGLLALSAPQLVAIHDAARPVVPDEMLARLSDTMKTAEACIPVIRVTETVKEIDAEGRVHKTHDRSKLVRVQTPQVFRYSLIRELHEKLAESSIDFTDDAMICESVGVRVMTCEGSALNVKVTTPEDVEMLERLVLWKG